MCANANQVTLTPTSFTLRKQKSVPSQTPCANLRYCWTLIGRHGDLNHCACDRDYKSFDLRGLPLGFPRPIRYACTHIRTHTQSCTRTHALRHASTHGRTRTRTRTHTHVRTHAHASVVIGTSMGRRGRVVGASLKHCEG